MYRRGNISLYNQKIQIQFLVLFSEEDEDDGENNS